MKKQSFAHAAGRTKAKIAAAALPQKNAMADMDRLAANPAPTPQKRE